MARKAGAKKGRKCVQMGRVNGRKVCRKYAKKRK